VVSRREAARRKAFLAKKFSGTKYTGLIKSTSDLRYWASVPDWKHRCRRCDKGSDEIGLCLDCTNLLNQEGRCFECFEMVVHLKDGYRTSCCTTCLHKEIEGGNPHGYKEGGQLGGGLRTNFYRSNTNDNSARMIEESN
jgi:hypothetical protein